MRRPVIPLLVALITGISVGNLVSIPDTLVLGMLLATLATLLFTVATGQKGLAASCLLISLFLLGIININSCLHPYCGRNDITLHAGKGMLTVEGQVCSPPRISHEKTKIVVNSSRIIKNGNSIPVRGKVLLSVIDSNNLFKYGNYIRARVKLKEPNNFNNPGGFDYKKYLLYRGIRLRGYAGRPSDIVIMRETTGNYFKTRIERYRSRLREVILENAPTPEGGILQALILGEKGGIPEDIADKFNRAGVSHILAISGLHVGIIAFIALIFIRTIMKSSEYLLLKFNIFKVSALFAVIPIIAYAFIAGLRISTVRATIMILCFLIALLAGRGRDMLNILAFAAFIILITSPASLFDISFQLSFVAVAAIILITPTLSGMLPKKTGGGIFRKVATDVVLFTMVSLSTMIGTYPLIALYFNRVSTITLLSNICIIPITGFAILPIGMLFIITAPCAPIATVLIQAASFFIRISVSIVDFLSSFPSSSFHVTTPTIPEFIFYYLLVITALKLADAWRSTAEAEYIPSISTTPPFLPVAITRLKDVYITNRKKFLILFMGFILLFFAVNTIYSHIKTSCRQYLEITFIDVGQGNSALIKFPGGDVMLVDGGGFYDRSFDLGKYVVGPYLWHEKIRKVDIMVLTHPDQDHIGGLPYIADNFEVGELWSNGCKSTGESFRRLDKIITKKNIPHRIVDKDTQEQIIGDVSISILNPAKSASGKGLHFPNSDYNDNGVVMKITFGNTSILLCADISRYAEADILASGADLQGDILLSPHHGSNTSSSAPFLKAVRPEIIVISCGPDNIFGFPGTEVLDRYTKAGIKILRTDKMGAITIRTDGEKIEVDYQRSKAEKRGGSIAAFHFAFPPEIC
ncbi:MAG: DNA internalization-related competence protein ComEC/Rec2 [Thermodesulfobacteriota bacterium]|nr:DNA internalization-related competence protein ComEC/Rec2 [Thermodesulfobacteriota bacterium]